MQCAENHKALVEELKGDEEIDEKLGETLRDLWADSGIQARCNCALWACVMMSSRNCVGDVRAARQLPAHGLDQILPGPH